MQPSLAGGFNIGFCSKHGVTLEHLQPRTKNQAQQKQFLEIAGPSPVQDFLGFPHCSASLGSFN